MATEDDTFATYTDAEGAFTFNLPTGNYPNLTISKEHYGTVTLGETATADEYGTYATQPATLSQLTKHVSGVAKLEGMNIHTGIVVSAYKVTGAGETLQTAVGVDAIGNFTFEYLPLGNYRFRYANDGAPSSWSRLVYDHEVQVGLDYVAHGHFEKRFSLSTMMPCDRHRISGADNRSYGMRNGEGDE